MLSLEGRSLHLFRTHATRQSNSNQYHHCHQIYFQVLKTWCPGCNRSFRCVLLVPGSLTHVLPASDSLDCSHTLSRAHPHIHSLAHPTYSPTHSPTSPLTYTPTSPPTHPPTHSPTHPPNQSLTHSRNNSPTHPPTHPPTHSLTHSLIHSLTHSFTHSLARSPIHPPTHIGSGQFQMQRLFAVGLVTCTTKLAVIIA